MAIIKNPITVLISGGDNPLEAITDSEIEALNVADNLGKVILFTGTTGTYANGALYIVQTA